MPDKIYYHFARFTNESIVPVPSSKTSLHCMRPIQERKTLSETCEQFFKVKNQMGQTNSGWSKVGSRKGPFTLRLSSHFEFSGFRIHLRLLRFGLLQRGLISRSIII